MDAPRRRFRLASRKGERLVQTNWDVRRPWVFHSRLALVRPILPWRRSINRTTITIGGSVSARGIVTEGRDVFDGSGRDQRSRVEPGRPQADAPI